MAETALHNRKLKVGTRASSLALAQVKEVFSLIPGVAYEEVIYETRGDKDKNTPLTTSPADDFFTDSIDQGVLSGEIDIAVHSAKDVPKLLKRNLTILALTPVLDDTDAFVGGVRFTDLQPGARIGTSSLLRQESLKALNPDLKAVDIRGTIEERIELMQEGEYDGIIVATCALKRLGLEHFITDIMPWEPAPLQGQLAVMGRANDQRVRRIFEGIDVRRKYGKVTLVGAGPGDPELITIKAIKAMEKTDYVFYDFLVDKELLKYAPQAEHVDVGKRKGKKTIPQEILSKMLKEKVFAGKNVVRLKGGDPLIFGRGADEISYLHEYHVRVDVIPGVSSATSIPSMLGIPLTARGVSSSVAFISGHSENEADVSPRRIDIPKAGTLVFLMGITKLRMIVQSLREACWGADTPIIIVSKGTRIDEKIVSGTLGNIEEIVAQDPVDPPALIVVGQTVRLWQEWAANDKRILYVGTNPDKYTALGNIVHVPMIRIEKISFEPREIQEILAELKSYHILLFTSRFAVKYFLEAIESAKFSLSEISHLDIATIGRDTAATLQEYQLTPKLVASVETSEGLFAALAERYELKGQHIFFPRSAIPNPYLKEELRKLGALVTELAVYRNLKSDRQDFPKENIGKVLFTSPSTVTNFLELYGMIPAHWKILSKGPRTSKTLHEAGYQSEAIIYE